MTIQQLPVYTGEIPALGQEQSKFNTNVSDKLAYDAQLVPAQNIYATEANALADQVQSDASDAESSAAAAASNSNFKGEWPGDPLSPGYPVSNIPASYRHNGRNWQQLQNIADITTQEPSENSFWAELSNVVITDIINPNLIRNSGFEIAGSVVNPPDATPRTYNAGDELFAGHFAVGALTGVTYVDGALNGSGQLYVDIQKSQKQQDSTSPVTPSIAGSDGLPKPGATVVDNGTSWRVTYAMSDTFSVKLEYGSVVTRHDVTAHDSDELKERFDPRGWGITFSGDETVKAQAMMNEVGIIKIPRGKVLEANITVDGGFTLSGDDRTSKFVGSVLQNNNTIASNVTIENLELRLNENMFYGGISTSQRAKNITYRNLNVIITSGGVTTCAAKNCDGFVISDVSITTEIPASGNAQYAFTMASVSGFDISNVAVDGAFEFGFESGGDGSGATPAVENGHFENIRINKSGGTPSLPGHHGFYLHGFKNVSGNNITVTGWGDPNYDVKFREGINGDFKDINAGRAFVNSNGGAGIPELQKLKDVFFTNFKANFGSLYSSGVGFIENVEFRGATGNFGFAPRNLDKGIVVSGIYERFGANLSGSSDGFNLIYKDCVIRSDVDAISQTYKFEGWPVFNGCTIESDIYTENSNVKIRNTNVNGQVYMNPTVGTYSLDVSNTHATGRLFTNTFSTRVVNAKISNSTFEQNEEVSTSGPSTKQYRGVGFLDGFYTTENNKDT